MSVLSSVKYYQIRCLRKSNIHSINNTAIITASIMINKATDGFLKSKLFSDIELLAMRLPSSISFFCKEK